VTTSDGRHAVPREESPPPQPPEEHRLARYLGRPLLLVFWTLVVWGTVYAGLLVLAVLTEGPSRAVARATTGPDGVVGIVNITLAVVAVAVWVIVGLTVVRVRSAPPDGERQDE
jgi:predicted neutral ceramidase superfamily lipid hydrolase